LNRETLSVTKKKHDHQPPLPKTYFLNQKEDVYNRRVKEKRVRAGPVRRREKRTRKLVYCRQPRRTRTSVPNQGKKKGERE